MNNEEVDIIEILKRVKEGKAPKRIQINGIPYEYDDTWEDITEIYQNDNWKWLYDEEILIALDTKIKILDKPIIEELKISEGHTDLSGLPYTVYPTKDEIIEKINQIIRHINKEEK